MNNDSQQLPELITTGRKLLNEINITSKQEKLNQLQAESIKPDFWNRPSAQNIMQKIGLLRQELENVEKLEQLINDLESYQQLINEAEADQPEEELAKWKQEAEQQTQQLQDLIEELKLKKYLSGPFDRSGAIVSIHPGQGGTEAMDWAEMLERMYLRYFERKNWAFNIINETKGEEAGIKDVSFEVNAPFAYGYLKGERGTHRLVRQSPFNADNLRQTSFALVEVLPLVEEQDQVEVKEEDLSWNFTRAGGPGGQSVNKTNSAVELTHEPTQIVVKARQSRSQVQNKETALKLLKAKLAQKQEQARQKTIQQEKGDHVQASWGTQIRNYVLHPYHLVKDTRTEIETHDTEAVLDGELDQFIKEEIKLDQV